MRISPPSGPELSQNSCVQKDDFGFVSKRLLDGGNSNIFYFHPYLGKIPILTSIFFKWVETTNQIGTLFFFSVFFWLVGLVNWWENGPSNEDSSSQ